MGETGTTLVLQVGYRGAGFAGYAAQEGERTVQGEVERALETLLRRPCETTCAGRTDAGVSALAQYVSLPVEDGELAGREPRRMWRSLMAITPEEVSIRGLYMAPAGFSARFDALGRRYRYRIACGNAQPVMAWEHAWWLRSPLDAGLMDEAARALVGEHDFSSFCKVSSAQMLREAGRSTSRLLREVRVSVQREAGEDLVMVDVEGNAFLHNMVRIMVGTLVEVGRGNRPPEWVAQALAARDRRAAGPTAPARGLVLEDVRYAPDLLVPWDRALDNTGKSGGWRSIDLSKQTFCNKVLPRD
ncbi:MAG: tRNA pseudouridine(38-40) synthase TruA [Coriobacteriales bacterium]|nr:tRNA pseudouridine(38-40) synthase TruA [Coriobacteriales bacterium]